MISDDNPRQNSDSDEQARREREAALHGLAGQPQPASSAEAPTLTRALPRSPSSKRRARPLILSAVLVGVLLAGGVGWWQFSSRSSTSMTGPLTLKFPDAHIACSLAITQSPDGKQVAVFGDTQCPGQSASVPPDPQVELFAVAPWQFQESLSLNAIASIAKPLIAALSKQGDPTTLAAISISFQMPFVWSPNGHEIMIGITLDAGKSYDEGAAIAPSLQGMLLMDISTHTARAIAPNTPPPTMTGAPPAPSSYNPTTVQRWDLSNRTMTFITLPQALEYTWDDQDALRSTTPLPSPWNATPARSPLGPVVDPIGGQHFTMWQQAQVYYNQDYVPCHAAFFPVQFTAAAWSPDGRYFINTIPVIARFPSDSLQIGTPTVPGPDCQPLPKTSPAFAYITSPPNFLAPLPIRDAGLAAALKAFAGEPFTTNLNLAWSPDGTRLAVEEKVRQETPAGHFTIYDCASGKILKQYTVDQLDPAFDQNNVTPLYLSWSPDSTQLLAYDYHRLVVLSGATLGR